MPGGENADVSAAPCGRPPLSLIAEHHIEVDLRKVRVALEVLRN